MTQQQKDILKAAVEINEEDLERANRIKEVMAMPGWQDIQFLYKQVHKAIWDLVKKSKKEENTWKLIGIMDGHDLTVDHPRRFVDLVDEKRMTWGQDMQSKKMDMSELDKLLGV